MKDEDEDGYGDMNINDENVVSGIDCDDNNSMTVHDMDCDGITTNEDCDDRNDSMPNNDTDCDGVLTSEDCNDNNNAMPNNDCDCDGITTNEDCDDRNDSMPNNDTDCDGVLTDQDCDDSDDGIFSSSNDNDCDGVITTNDCNDLDPSLLSHYFDTDCDGVLITQDCDDSDPMNDRTCIFIPLDNGTNIELVLISGIQLIDPLSRYTLTRAFYMMTTEVTQGVYQEVMGYDARLGLFTDYGDGENFPAYYVTWDMAAHFANHLSTLENEELCYSCSGSSTTVTCSEVMDPYLCSGYSLPTEHEWEIAARSGSSTDFWTGEGTELGGTYSEDICDSQVTIQDGVNNPLLSDYAWFCGSDISNHRSNEVALTQHNDYGLYDMHGNVKEWMADWYGCDYPHIDGDWCLSGQSRTTRGGGYSTPSSLIVSKRTFNSPTNRSNISGFRLRKLYIPPAP